MPTARENWFWPTFRDGFWVSVAEQNSFAEQIETGTTIRLRLPFEHLDTVDVTFDGAGTVGEGESVSGCITVGFRATNEAVQQGQIIRPDRGHPGIEIFAAGAASSSVTSAAR
ncbi:hypothetical protein ACIBED_08775 [Rhodococcus coprophilus]|uniref:hypothetical protein n=1 Tax=Rhodococcus coprophilus TaxID=38310 RepID=UPI0033EF6789